MKSLFYEHIRYRIEREERSIYRINTNNTLGFLSCSCVCWCQIFFFMLHLSYRGPFPPVSCVTANIASKYSNVHYVHWCAAAPFILKGTPMHLPSTSTEKKYCMFFFLSIVMQSIQVNGLAKPLPVWANSPICKNHFFG